MNVKTSSIQIELAACDFDKLQQDMRIFVYPLPEIVLQLLKDWKNGYANLHIWAKNNCDFPYYLHTRGANKALYMAISPEVDPPALEYKGVELQPQHWEEFQSPDKVHIWLKVLLAHFLFTHRHQVANESLYLFTKNQRKSRQTVLKVGLAHHFKTRNPQSLEFFLNDKATRMTSLTYEDWQARRRKGRKIGVPYELAVLSGIKSPVFRQIKTDALAPQTEIWVEDTYRKDRSKLSFHDLSSAEELEKSRVGLLYRLQQEFIQFAAGLGVAIKPKNLEMRRLVKDTKEISGLSDDHRFTFRLDDARIEKKYPLQKIHERIKRIAEDRIPFPFTLAKPGEGQQKSLPELFLMDYEPTDFGAGGKFEGKKDPYEGKKNWTGYPTQGLRIEETWLDESAAKASPRNAEIAIKQLYLKTLVSQSQAWAGSLPHASSLEGMIFFRKRGGIKDPKFSWGYIQKGAWQAGSATGFPEAQQILDPKLREITGRSFQELWEAWAFYHEYEQKIKQGGFNWHSCDLMISTDFIWEIGELDERYLYDVDRQLSIQREREKKRPIRSFLANEEGPDPELAIAYNQFLRENLRGVVEISFKELIKKYGKPSKDPAREGFLKSVFGKSTLREGTLSFFRNSVGIEVYGTKETKVDPSLNLVRGIWFDEDRQQYFVGQKDNYKNYNQDKGFPMRQIICLEGKFDPDLFFPLLNVDFIRNEQFTVRPYPFALLSIWEDLNILSTQI